MLKKSEVIGLLVYLAGAFPGRLKYPSGVESADAAMVKAYQKALERFDIKIAMAAAEKYVATGTEWPPSAGQLALVAEKIMSPVDDLSPAEAWHQVQRAFDKHSPHYQYQEFMAMLTEDVQAAVKAIGVDTLLNASAKDTYIQNLFQRVYEQLKEAHREKDKLEIARNQIKANGNQALLEGKGT